MEEYEEAEFCIVPGRARVFGNVAANRHELQEALNNCQDQSQVPWTPSKIKRGSAAVLRDDSVQSHETANAPHEDHA